MGGGGPGRRAPEGWEAGAPEGELQKGGRRGPWKASPRRVGGGGPGRRDPEGWEAGALEGGQDGVQKLKRDVLG